MHFINHRGQREHGGKSMARGHSRREWGRAKTNTLPAGLPDFCFFFGQSQLAGSNPSQSEKSVVRFSKNGFARKSRGLFSFSATGGERPAFNVAQNLRARGPQRTNPRLNLASAGRREKSLHYLIGLHGPWQGVDYLAREIAPPHRFPFL